MPISSQVSEQRTAVVLVAVFLFALGTKCIAAGEDMTIIHAGTLLAVPGEQPANEQSILVQDDRIMEIRSGYVTVEDIGKSADIIDLTSHFVMPGFIDCHVHLHWDGVSSIEQFFSEQNFMTATEYALRAVNPVMRTLRQGFTTLRDTSGHTTAIRDLRNAINAGHIDGPRLIVAVDSVEAPGGNDDFTAGLRDDLMTVRARTGTCSGADDCRSAVRGMFKLGADFIKADNESLTWGKPATPFPKLTDEEMFAIVDAAHRLGLKVSVHAMGGTIEQAVLAGADSIEHGWEMPVSAIEAFRDSNTYISATLTSLREYADLARDPNSPMSDAQRKWRLERWDATIAGFARALKAGVKFSFATDSGGVRHGENLKEFLYMEEFGMTPMEAIKSATIHAADLTGLGKQIGTLEAGKVADIIAVANNPLDNMKNLLDMRFVMARGKIYRHD